MVCKYHVHTRSMIRLKYPLNLCLDYDRVYLHFDVELFTIPFFKVSLLLSHIVFIDWINMSIPSERTPLM